MTERLTIIPQPVVPRSNQGAPNNRIAKTAGSGHFDQLLQHKIDQQGVKFSRHAVDRMNSRGVQLNPTQIQRLEQALARVEAKGGRDSLVMIDDAALVVSVRNQTVVTVVDREHLKDNIFTNIDSAVFA